MKLLSVLAAAGALTFAALSSAFAEPQPRNVEVGLVIWNQADAEERCPKAAAEAGAKWTGHWSNTTAGRMSVCEVVDLPKEAPKFSSPRGEARDVEAGPIWNQADAEMKCPAVAAAARGRWNGQWRTTEQGRMSVCGVTDIDLRVRDVDAGPIWNQADAELKCPVAAFAVRGQWNGQWRTTEQGRMSVCQITDGRD
jgi:ribosome modulation factor